MNFKARKETIGLLVVLSDLQGMSSADLRVLEVRKGNFEVDFHYLIQEDGKLETGREKFAVAGSSLDPRGVNLCVRVETNGLKSVSDCSKVTLADLISDLKGEFGDLKIKVIKG